MKRWELAGLNEVNGTATSDTETVTFSGFVQLNNTTLNTSSTDNSGVTTTYTGTLTYGSQIQQIVSPSGATDTPTMPGWALIALGGLLCALAAPQIRRC